MAIVNTYQAKPSCPASSTVCGFTKVLVDRDGNVARRFSPQTDPADAQLRSAIEEALG